MSHISFVNNNNSRERTLRRVTVGDAITTYRPLLVSCNLPLILLIAYLPSTFTNSIPDNRHSYFSNFKAVLNHRHRVPPTSFGHRSQFSSAAIRAAIHTCPLTSGLRNFHGRTSASNDLITASSRDRYEFATVFEIVVNKALCSHSRNDLVIHFPSTRNLIFLATE